MNERLVFFLSVVVAEFGSSAITYLLSPDLSLVQRAPDFPAYLESHALPSLCVWALIAGLSAALMPKLWRRRQNRSSKLAVLVRIGVLGLVIDAASSLYLWLSASTENLVDQSSPVSHALLRLGLYAILFATVVAVADAVAAWHARRNPPTMTPPPRFGKA